MNYNLSQFNFGTLLSTMCSGYSNSYSPIGALFSGVDSAGSGSIFNYVNSTGYYGTSTETNYNSFIGYGLASVGISILGALGLGVFNKIQARKAERNARPAELQSQLDSYNNDIRSQLQILGKANEDEALGVDVDAAVRSAQSTFNNKKDLYTQAQDRTKTAQENYDKLKERERILAKPESDRTDVEKQYLVDTSSLNMTLGQAEVELRNAKADEEQAKAEYEEAERNLRAAEANKPNLIEAQTKLSELIEKRNALKAELDGINAQKNADTMDRADGSSWFRTNNYEFGGDGSISTQVDDFKNSDWKGLINEYRTTTDANRKTKIKDFVTTNWTYIQNNVRQSIRSGLEIIKNS